MAATSSSSSSYSFEDHNDFRRLTWEWAKAYDTKDWNLLRSICSPTMQWLYSGLSPAFVDKEMTAEEFVAAMSAPEALGDVRVSTQHLLGNVLFEERELHGEKTMTGNWQIRAAHRRVLADGTSATWDCSSYVRHYYARDEAGRWRLGGVQPHTVLTMEGRPEMVVGTFP